MARIEARKVFESPVDRVSRSIHERYWDGLTRHYYAITFGERYIWGVTAGILRNLHDRIYK